MNIEGEIYRFNENTICQLCNVQNSLIHMFRKCEVFKVKINNSLLPMDGDCIDLYRILEAPDLKIMRKFYAHLRHILYKNSAVIIHLQT